VGVELVEALFQRHLTGERDYAIVIGMGIEAFANHGVAHLQGPGINPQYSHHTPPVYFPTASEARTPPTRAAQVKSLVRSVTLQNFTGEVCVGESLLYVVQFFQSVQKS
jgi:hypothetical protein